MSQNKMQTILEVVQKAIVTQKRELGFFKVHLDQMESQYRSAEAEYTNALKKLVLLEEEFVSLKNI